jgi:hypothetical protein
MKQTAVEWVAQELLRAHPIQTNHDVIEQAKEMEKQQVIDAFKRGTINEMNGIEEINSEEYYNETFKKK